MRYGAQLIKMQLKPEPEFTDLTVADEWTG